MPSDNKALVLGATDIVELIGQTVALKRTGKDFVGLCPFHQEKTPSFHVSPAKQFFYCYGCKAGGNAIDFVIKRDRVQFVEAMEILARRSGIELVRSGGQQKTGERQALLDVHTAAARFFENLLSQEVAKDARAYLAKRGFDESTLKRFAVGFAPPGWDNLLNSPVGRKFGWKVLAEAGLIKVRPEDNRAYDTFRNRIMFPIRDEGGRIIAFGGRVMPGSDDPAKYLNSPETPLFSKGRCAFGLDLARQRIVETRTVAVVEGYTDVMMAQQFGVANVVSVLGTAMTEQHVSLLRRYADRIVLLFDADTAGDLAVARVVQLFLTQPVEIGVASIPQGMDPDEFLLASGSAAFEKVLSDATDALSYAWRQLVRQFNAAGGLTGQQQAAQQYLEMLAGARGAGPVDALRWGAALARVSRLTEIPIEQLHRRFRGRAAAKPASPAAAQSPALPAEPAVQLSLAQEQAERWLLGALLVEPSRWHELQAQVDVDEFQQPQRRQLARVYWDHQREEGEPQFAEFLSGMDEQVRTLAIELVQEVGELNDLSAAVDSAIKHFADQRRKRQERTIAAQLMAGKEQPLAEETEIDLLRKLSESAGRPDTGRLGPRPG